MKKLVLAEKPSVGREIAKSLGCFDMKNGYIESNDWVVTWALGHLVELAPPTYYDAKYKRWSIFDLPMLPEHLEEVVSEETKDQFNVIDSLIKREDVESVVVATDAGREGELVARWIIKETGSTKPMVRLWINSQTDRAIKEGFMNLRPSSEFDNLYKAAESRAEADWYVGLNVSRALTCHYDSKLSSGRVQTPTLALISKREDEIEAFERAYYYTARGNFGNFFASYYTDEDTVKFNDDERYEALSKLENRKGKVVSLTTEENVEETPLAYDLTELQRDANVILGFSAKETLDILQGLYERHKIVTYPRTDSRYISDDIVPTLRERIKALSDTAFSRQVDEYLLSGYREDNPRFVNSSLVSDHHAIIPTEEKPDISKLSLKEKELYELVAMRFLEVLGEDRVYKSITAKIDVDGYIFKTRLTLNQKKGFRNVRESAELSFSMGALDDAESPYALMSLKEGDEVDLLNVKVRKNTTNPPERYTDATLLSAMEHAGRLVEDEELKAHLVNGLGTPATRADMIEKLIQNRYVEREGKYLIPTAKGRELVKVVPEVLSSAELTGKWEERLELIKEGKESPDIFISDIKKMTVSLVNDVKTSKAKFEPKYKEFKECPYCHSAMPRFKDADGSDHYICDRLSCQYEEREVKVKVETLQSEGTKKISTSPDGKIRVTINKKGTNTKLPKAIYETKVEVVKPSHYRPKVERESAKSYKDERKKPSQEKQNKSFHKADSSSSPRPRRESSFGEYSGGTMADFFKLSKERDEERKNKGKNS